MLSGGTRSDRRSLSPCLGVLNGLPYPQTRAGSTIDRPPETVDVHTPKANVQYTTLDRKPLKSVRNRHQTNTILNTSHEPKSTTVLELKYRSYEMFTIIQEFTEKYRGFRGSLFSIHPLSGCERLPETYSDQRTECRRRRRILLAREHRSLRVALPRRATS